MIKYPMIDPVAFHIGPWPVHWYGLMYLVGFLGGWLLLSERHHYNPREFTQEQIADTVFFAALGAILGGRFGYILFYDWPVFVADPSIIVKIWTGGMSFHGGLIGVFVALLICSKYLKKPVLALTDLIAPAVPLGLGAGRIGNFINGEVWGRITDVPWAMVFPNGGPSTRHPSQLYEFLLEGVVMFIFLWIFSNKPRPLGAVSGLFALLYGIFRFFVEFFREPDIQIGYHFGWMTQGQLLSIPLILIGIGLLIWAYTYNRERLV